MIEIILFTIAKLAVMVRTHFALAGEVLSELAYKGSNKSGPENSMLEWDRRCGLPRYSLLLRARLAVDDPDDPPAFDGLKVFPSLAGLSIARFDSSSVQACQPAGVSAHRVSALAPQSGGLRRIIDAEMSKYLSNRRPRNGT